MNNLNKMLFFEKFVNYILITYGINSNMKDILLDKIKSSIPVYDIGLKCGSTGYIDFVTVEDLGDNDIVQGIDVYKRHFISIRYRLIGKNNEMNTIKVITIFKRYTDNDTIWVNGTYYGRDITNSVVIDDDTIWNKYFELLLNGVYEYTETPILYTTNIKSLSYQVLFDGSQLFNDIISKIKDQKYLNNEIEMKPNFGVQYFEMKEEIETMEQHIFKN